MVGGREGVVRRVGRRCRCRVCVSPLICVTVKVKQKVEIRSFIFFWFTEHFSCLFAFGEASIVKRRKMADGGNQKQQGSQCSQSYDPRRQGGAAAGGCGAGLHVHSKENAGAMTLGGVETSGKSCAVREEDEYDDKGIKVGLSLIDHEGAKRCAITGMLVGTVCCLYNGNGTPCSERVEREGVLTVKFKSMCPSSSTSQLEEQGRHWQYEAEPSIFCSVSTSEKMCAITRKTWSGQLDGEGLPVREPPPKTASVAFAGSSWKENAASKDATDAQEGPAAKAQK